MPTQDTGSFVAGHYAVTWGSASLGTTEVGFNFKETQFKEGIKIDDFGDTEVDGIVRGFQTRVDFVLSEWKAAGRQAVMFPYTDSGIGIVDGVGRTIVGGGYAKSLVFTPVSNIHNLNKTWTFPLSIPEGDVAWTLSTKLRTVAVKMIAYPNRATGATFTEV